LPINGVSPNVIAHTTSIPITPAPCHYVTLSPSHPVTYHVRDPREESGMPWPEAFAAITKTNEPLAPYTHLKLGGPVESFGLRTNAGDRSGEIGQYVRRVEVLSDTGGVDIRDRDELQFEEHHSNLDDAVILAAEFELEPDSAEAIVKRMRKAWILRKAEQPF